MAAAAKSKDPALSGFNLFLEHDNRLFLTLARGTGNISSYCAADLRANLAGLSPGRASYRLKRLGTNGVTKTVANRYENLTTLGRRVLVTARVIPG